MRFDTALRYMLLSLRCPRCLLYTLKTRDMHRPHYHIIAGHSSEDVSFCTRALNRPQ